MQEIIGDIFDYISNLNLICIPTNGDVTKKGQAIMGAGLAKIAAERFPELPVMCQID